MKIYKQTKFFDHKNLMFSVSKALFRLRQMGKPYLLYCETSVCEHCNLNCKTCTHFCPLVTKPTFTDLKTFMQDLQVLSKKLAIRKFRLMGGEPLLHPQINDFLRVTRQAFPHTKIQLVTNGILLPKMPKSFWETMRRYKIYLHWSKYPPMKNQEADLLSLIRSHRVRFDKCPEIIHFIPFTPFGFEGKEDPKKSFSSCLNNHCVNLWHGKLYTCPACYVTHANAYFHESHEVPEGWDIRQYSGKELQSFVNRPIPFCRYCKTQPLETIPWELSQRKREEWS